MTVRPPWPTVRLEEVAQIQTGLAKGKPPDQGIGAPVPYLRVANVQDGYVDLTELKTIVVAPQALQRYLLREGDVLFTEGGDADKLGRGCVWKAQVDPCIHQNHIFAARPSRDVLLPSFLAAYAAGPLGKDYFLNCAKQTTNLASINSTQLKSFPIPIPPLPEQRKIAAILSSVDDVIEGTQAVIDQLQVVKKAMMAELLTRGLPGRHTRFKQTEIGEVPEAWQVVRLDSLATKVTDGEHQTPKRESIGTLLLSARNVLDGVLALDNVDYVGEEEFARISLRCNPEHNDILISCSGSVGRVCLVPPGLRFVLVRSVALVKLDCTRVVPEFVEQTLRSEPLQQQMRQSQKQAAQANLFQGPIRALLLPSPALDEQREVANVLGTFDDRIASEQNALRGLRAAKSALMSALLTGELRVTPDEATL